MQDRGCEAPSGAPPDRDTAPAEKRIIVGYTGADIGAGDDRDSM